MALKLIKTFGENKRVVKVYRDSEWNEYRARLYVNGVLYAPADAHDDDKESIMGTAQYMVKEPAKAKKPVKKSAKSAVAILNELEKKPRKNPSGRVAKKSYIIQHLIAPNDINGNPKRGWLVWWHKDGKVIGFVDEGHRGRQALGEYLKHHLIDLGSISVTGAIYSMAKKELRVNK